MAACGNHKTLLRRAGGVCEHRRCVTREEQSKRGRRPRTRHCLQHPGINCRLSASNHRLDGSAQFELERIGGECQPLGAEVAKFDHGREIERSVGALQDILVDRASIELQPDAMANRFAHPHRGNTGLGGACHRCRDEALLGQRRRGSLRLCQ